MAARVIDDSKLQDIAVAVQSKDGGGQMTVDQMPTRITAISTMLASNYIDLSSFEITTGANSISNTTQLYSYFNSIATSRGFQSVVAISIVGDIVFSKNLILNTAPSGEWYRYRDSRISAVPNSLAYDASIPEGTRYVIYGNKKELPR